MKRFLVVCGAILLLVVGLCGCGAANLPDELVGEWNCEDFASDGKTATEFYAMYINADGSFSLYDTVGNPGIAGTMRLKDDGGKDADGDAGKGVLEVSCGSDDFDPPLCWDMSEKDELDYEISENGELRLGHNGVWLSFEQND